MAKRMRRTALYVILLAAGVTLGMQLAESGTADIYGPGFQSGGFLVNGQESPSHTEGQLQQNMGQNPDSGMTPGGAPNWSVNQEANSHQQNNQAGGGSVIQTPADVLLPPQEPPAVDRFADKAANLLQRISQKSIHWVASLFGPAEE
ncbi:hypothetical protein ACFQ3W_15750 [Paenibacillus puldeungensis]|uniref:Uncharacterized protein n=1 Tax=Paenibacillus puldeungensis TaxID=696536 RepID=A0ABW3S0Q8_9BACL